MVIIGWYRRWTRAQILVILPIVITLAGAAATTLGAGAAESFANFEGVQYIARVSGILMWVGGTVTLVGMYRRDPFWETIGLVTGSTGVAIFSIGTVIGFGTGGIVSGLMAMGIALVLIERVLFTIAEARARRHITEGDYDSG